VAFVWERRLFAAAFVLVFAGGWRGVLEAGDIWREVLLSSPPKANLTIG
jgi:hypothetical protein